MTRIKVAVLAGGDVTLPNAVYDYYVGVDRGSLILLENHFPLDMAVGDFDSVTSHEWEIIQSRSAELVRAQAEKNDTDTELALKLIFDRFPQAQVTLYGAFGGRLDHLMSNIFLPSDPALTPFMTQIRLLDNQNAVSYLPAGRHSIFPDEKMTYISFMTEGQGRLSIHGAKYELTPANFFTKKMYSSNEFKDQPIDVTLTAGYLIVIQTRDRRK
ncbi:thiamine diphosphokinase [Streptococcus dentiloxodontae]